MVMDGAAVVKINFPLIDPEDNSDLLTSSKSTKNVCSKLLDTASGIFGAI